jgi:hypothetical protein
MTHDERLGVMKSYGIVFLQDYDPFLKTPLVSVLGGNGVSWLGTGDDLDECLQAAYTRINQAMLLTVQGVL